MMVKMVRGANPRVRFADTDPRGYGVMELTEARCEVTFRAVANAKLPASPVRDLARFVVEAGRTGLQDA